MLEALLSHYAPHWQVAGLVTIMACITRRSVQRRALAVRHDPLGLGQVTLLA